MNSPAHAAAQPSADARRSTLIRGLLCGGFAVFVWGSYLAVSRAGVVAAGLLPWDFALFRFLPAGVLGAILLDTHSRRRKLLEIGWRRALALSVCGGPLFIGCATGGYLFAPLPHGAVVQPGSAVVMGLLFARLYGDSGAGSMTWAGAFLIVVGLGCANLGDGTGGATSAWIGECLFIAAGTLWAGFTVLLKRWQIDPVTGTSLVSILSLLATLPLYGVITDYSRLGDIAPSQLVLQFVMQGVLAGFLAVLAFVKAVQLLGPAHASLLPALVPMCAILVGIPITGEHPSQGQLAGLALVTLGLLLASGIVRHLRRR